jgi:Pyridoxamine 5'-phosphate oxidase
MASITPWLEELSHEECLALLRSNQVGRLALTVDEFPMILPINYVLAEPMGRTWIALRTRPGGAIDRAPLAVAFEIDGIDPFAKRGWSVVVRGTMHHIDETTADFDDRFDPRPWLADRDEWLVIDPATISGRRLHPAEIEWVFHARAYI